MAKLLDWEARLGAYLDAVRLKPFGWGSHDCILHCANGVKAQTGKDHARGMRGKYRSAASAARFLKSLGHDSLVDLVTAKLGEPIPPSFAQRGDIVMSEDGAFGICMGSNAFFVGQEGERPGLLMVHRNEKDRSWVHAWRVGG